MNEDIKLSIVIPHYNDSKRLFRLIDSIPSKRDVEIIIVDDHSEHLEFQKVIDYLKTSARDNLFCFSNQHKENSAGICRNEGLNHARGQWVIFADADDYFLEGMYDAVANEFESVEDIIYFPPNSIKEDGSYSDRHGAYRKIINNYIVDKSLKSELYIRMIESPCSKMIRMDLIRNNHIEFDPTRYSNDVMFCTKTGILAKRVKAVDRCIYMITEAEGSLTKIKNKVSFDVRKQVLINRYVYVYRILGKEKTKMLGMKYAGIRYIVSPIKNGYGIKLSIKYLKMLINERVPLVII